MYVYVYTYMHIYIYIHKCGCVPSPWILQPPLLIIPVFFRTIAVTIPPGHGHGIPMDPMTVGDGHALTLMVDGLPHINLEI